MRRDTLLALLVVFGVLVGSLPAAASGMVVGAGGSDGPAAAGASTTTAASQQSNETRNDTQVNVSVGQQLSTVIAVTEEETESAVEQRAFTIATTGANESERAAAVAERAAELRTTAAAIREAYHNATAAYEAGELTTSEYARRIAVLNARAQSVRESHQRLRGVAANVSAQKLRAAGYRPNRTHEAVASLAPVTGSGAKALRKRFTGKRSGAVTVDTERGLDIAVRGEQGRTHEVDRAPDADHNLTVSRAAALDTARDALSATNGTWELTASSARTNRGTYRFGFRLDAEASRGRATVVVDGSSGAVVRLQEQVRPVHAGENDRDGDGGNTGQEQGNERSSRTETADEGADRDDRGRSGGNETGSRSGNRSGTDSRPGNDNRSAERSPDSADDVATESTRDRSGDHGSAGGSPNGHSNNSTAATTSRTDG